MNLSNNDIMWDCMVDIFNGNKSQLTEDQVKKFLDSYHEHGGDEVEYNFSHDNWTVVVCWIHLFKPEFMKRFPIVGKHSRHPVRLIRFLWMKYRCLSFLKPVSIGISLLSRLLFTAKDSSGRLHTSGLLLDHYIAISYDVKLWVLILTEIVEERDAWGSWENVYKIYHGDPERYNYKVYLAYKNYEEITNEGENVLR